MTSLVQITEHPQSIHEIRLMRPDARNAISTSMATELVEVLEELARNTEVRAVLLTGEGPSFCVGADLKERSGFTEDELAGQRPVFRSMFRALRNMPMPAVAAIHGHALGGGLELAMSCDVIVADSQCLVGLPEVRVGLIPAGGGTQLLVRRVGRGRAAELILSGRHVTAQEALTMGVVDHISDGDVHPAAMAVAQRIATASPASVRAAKAAIAAAIPGLEDGLFVEENEWRTLISGPDRQEGIRAFVEKRDPQWSVPEGKK
jgi:enoyl-CoA hydratase/carnithine racemase